jgi:beta-glucosidase
VLPAGVGAVNQAGLHHYKRLIDTLLEANIKPFVTLFHWDYPLDLYHRGGWQNPDSPKWFAEYTQLVVSALGDRVADYITLNEPQVFVILGHHRGIHAPGDRLSLKGMLQVGHHALLAHGRAVQAIRAERGNDARIGFSPVVMPRIPQTDSAADVDAARQATFAIASEDAWTHSWWIDPVFLGRYPQQGLEVYGADVPNIGSDDFEIISQPVDFLGVNTYLGLRTRADGKGAYQDVPFPDGHPHTAFNWPVTPEALYWGPRFLTERYQAPIVISETGISMRDGVSTAGAVHDPARIDYTTRYLRELHRAIADGADVRGYLHWSIMDNFEWAEGYKERFGLIYVDYETQARTLKDSAHWYRGVIASNGNSALASIAG